MDGVLCDFERQWARVAGVPFTQFSKMSLYDRWEPVRKHGSFWETIPWKGDGRALWSYIKKHDVRILSAYSSSDSNCLPGKSCLLYTSPSPRDRQKSRMPSSA